MIVKRLIQKLQQPEEKCIWELEFILVCVPVAALGKQLNAFKGGTQPQPALTDQTQDIPVLMPSSKKLLLRWGLFVGTLKGSRHDRNICGTGLGPTLCSVAMHSHNTNPKQSAMVHPAAV